MREKMEMVCGWRKKGNGIKEEEKGKGYEGRGKRKMAGGWRKKGNCMGVEEKGKRGNGMRAEDKREIV